MKILKNWIKTHEQKNKLDLINELLISGSVEENIELFNKVKSKFHYEMDLERNRKEKDINLINRIRPIKECDPNFDRPLSEIETNYEIVTP
jgi:gamma-glutamyl-gamma-aminobutyrate hydrolase PuuD